MIAWILIVTEVVVTAGKRPATYEVPSRYAAGPPVSVESLSDYLFHNWKPEPLALASRTLALSHLDSALAQSTPMHALIDIGLLALPETLDFGSQQLCVPAIRFVQLWTEEGNVVFLKEIVSSDTQFRLMKDGEKDTIVTPGRSIHLKMLLLPQRLGMITAQLTIETTLGKATYPMRAYITDNRFHLHPISLTAPRSVFFTNTDSAPVQVIDVFSMNDYIVVLSDEKYPYAVDVNQTTHLIAVSYINSTAPGTIVVRTNHTNYYLPVTPHQLSFFPSSVSFGIINSQALRHSVALLASNFDQNAVRVTAIRADSLIVTVNLRKREIPGKSANESLADLRFYPRVEGYYEGWIEVHTNATDLPITIPYRGYALYNLVEANETELAFHPSDSEPRDVHLSVPQLRKLNIQSIVPPRPLFSLRNFKRSRALSPKPRIAFTLVPKVPYEYLGTRFVSLETEQGVVAVPAAVEDGSVHCAFAASFDSCLYYNAIDAGELRYGELYEVELVVGQRGRLQQHLLARCGQCGHAVNVSYYANNETVFLLKDSVSFPAVQFPSHSRLSLLISIRVGSGPPSLSVELHSIYQIYEFSFRWSALHTLEIAPTSIDVDTASFAVANRVNITLQHTYDDPLVLTSISGDFEALAYSPFLEVVRPHQAVVIGQVVFPRRRDLLVCDFPEELSLAELAAWEIGKMGVVERRVAGKVKLAWNNSEVVEISVRARETGVRLGEREVAFGKVTPGKVYQRFLRVENPLNFDICVQLMVTREVKGLWSWEPTLLRQQLSRYRAASAFSLTPPSAYTLPALSTSFLGPISFSPASLGSHDAVLLLRNNATALEAVPLSGELLSGLLYVEPVADLRATAASCRPLPHTLEIVNIGNAPVLLRRFALAGDRCAYRGLSLPHCDLAALLFPGESVQVELEIAWDFVEQRVRLTVETEDEELEFSIEVRLPVERVQCGEGGSLALAFLEAVAIGVVLSLAQESVWGLNSHKEHLSRGMSAPISASPFPVSENIDILPDKKKVKKHKRKKVPPLVVVDTSPPRPDGSDDTCKKEPCTIMFPDPAASNKSTIVGENMLEAKMSESDDYLDEYKQSGLFSGFVVDDISS